MDIETLNDSIKESGLRLEKDSGGLSLIGQDGSRMQGDFTRMLPRLRQSNLSGELLVKAARIKDTSARPVVLDATAGMGEDSLLLAAAGFEVFLYEKDPVIAALLTDALDRAARSEEPVLVNAVGHMHFTEGDSIAAMKMLSFVPDVVFLDPMFPERRKSAKVRKKFQLIHGLEEPCADEETMLAAALEIHPHKVVIKRPTKGPFLAGRKPSYSLAGKAVRYDCIVLARTDADRKETVPEKGN